ncbi:RHS repeat-associated core domain-containing protein [Flavobacterium amniphilum]|uniref:RHS repeat-associated core domain-containing protein n=1 Tax=Flavobacterium amniphilum TaxID=1834035 RepID=UPI002029DFBB|nr:RHS repeat-associated core domain-containing protein [Flavobacterium amniphilum]MCL9806907.1 RHS repeat-associated core domain-containing protein [Flavobacterium amniphilum]
MKLYKSINAFNKLTGYLLLFFGSLPLFAQTVEAVPDVGTSKNWASSISYDLNGNTISKGVSYFNVLGKGTQQLSWDKLTNRVWASEVRYDYFNRPVLQTLTAPVNASGDFTYQSNFILSGGTPVGIQQYDAAGTLWNPPVISSDVNSLGWYYSNSNTLDAYQDVTSYPYTRSIYSDLSPGTARAVLGGNKINGNWLQTYSFSMTMELPVTSSEPFYAALKNSKVIKTVSRDVHGVESVVYVDTDGKMLGAARSGEGSARNVYSDILDKSYVDIHIPQGCGGTVVFANLTTSHQIRVYDLITETDITSTLSGSAISSSNSSITFQPGFYRIEEVNKYYYNNLKATSVPSPVRITYKVNYYDLSKSEYDFQGRLVKSTQPLNVLTSNELSSTFEYDYLGQVLKTTSPDEGTGRMKYRNDGQIRFSQNDEQVKKGSFSYTNYDELGRPVESGVYTGNEIVFSAPGVSDEGCPDDLSYNGPPLVDCIIDLTDGLPSTGRTEQNFIGYDLPDPDLAAKLNASGLSGTVFKQNFVAGAVSYSYTQNPYTTKTWYSYDIFGRVEWVLQEIPGITGLKSIQYQYDPANGNVVKVLYQKYNASETFVHKYDYNAIGQLTDVSTSVNDTNFTKQAHYIYNESGALKRTELAESLQGIDYVYNLSGQLKAINHPSLSATNDPGNDGANGFAADVFGIALDYYNGDYTRNNLPKPLATTTAQGTDQYNGNIKSTRWNTQVGSASHKAYTYQYNKNNWLSQATFGLATTAGVFTANANNDYQEGNLTYDANGNIKAMKRTGYTDGNGTNSMDNFTYVYDAAKPNQLKYVKDIADNAVTTRYSDLKNQEKDLQYSGSYTEKVSNYVYNDLGQLIYNVQDKVGYKYNASGLVTEIKTHSSSNTGDFVSLYSQNYSSATTADEAGKWTLGTPQVTYPFTRTGEQDMFCFDSVYPHGNGLQLLGTQTASTKLRVLPNTYTKIDLDVIVDKNLYYTGNPTVGPDGEETYPTSSVDIKPVVTVRLKKQDGTLINSSVINNATAEYCTRLFDQHVSFAYTPANEEYVTLEIQTQKTYSGSASYKQRIFVDNLSTQIAQVSKVAFVYNDRGQRVKKESYLTGGNINATYYVRDVSGSVMAVHNVLTTSGGSTPQLVENTVYGGTGRIGVFKRDASPEKGFTLYEMTDHLGNVRAIIRKVGTALVSLTGKSDYYPFGMPLPNQQITDANYRYAFQGQEKDPETGMEAFELRLWDGRLGRWLTVDPMGQYFSPYLGMGNNPISRVDPDGGMDGDPPLFTTAAQTSYQPVREYGPQLDVGMSYSLPDVAVAGSRYSYSSIAIGGAVAMDAQMMMNLTLTRGMQIEAFLAADDVSGIGAWNDFLIPVVGVGTIGTMMYYGSKIPDVDNRPTFSEARASGNLSCIAGVNTYKPEYKPTQYDIEAVFANKASVDELIHRMSKGGRRNVWPDGQYDKPNPSDIDWSSGGDGDLADEVTGPNPPGGKGPGSPWNQIKKWFKNKRAEFNGKKR